MYTTLIWSVVLRVTFFRTYSFATVPLGAKLYAALAVQSFIVPTR